VRPVILDPPAALEGDDPVPEPEEFPEIRQANQPEANQRNEPLIDIELE
jgi:hypothetical protein